MPRNFILLKLILQLDTKVEIQTLKSTFSNRTQNHESLPASSSQEQIRFYKIRQYHDNT